MNDILKVPSEASACCPYIKLAKDILTVGNTLNDAYVSICLLQKASSLCVDLLNNFPVPEQKNAQQFTRQLKNYLGTFKTYIDYNTDKGKVRSPSYEPYGLSIEGADSNGG